MKSGEAAIRESRALNRGSDHRESYTLQKKKEVVVFYLQRCREYGEVISQQKQKNKKQKQKQKQALLVFIGYD